MTHPIYNSSNGTTDNRPTDQPTDQPADRPTQRHRQTTSSSLILSHFHQLAALCVGVGGQRVGEGGGGGSGGLGGRGVGWWGGPGRD